MEVKNYLLIENEESVTSVDGDDASQAIYDGETVNVEIRKNGKGNQGRRATAFNLELLKSAFSALGQAHLRDSEQQTIQEINLSFCDLSYSVKHGIRRGELLIITGSCSQLIIREESRSQVQPRYSCTRRVYNFSQTTQTNCYDF